MMTMPHPFATAAAENRLAESFWLTAVPRIIDKFVRFCSRSKPLYQGLRGSEQKLNQTGNRYKEAKAALRSRDPVDAANDVDILCRWADRASHARQALWADLHCGDILQTSTAALQGDHNG